MKNIFFLFLISVLFSCNGDKIAELQKENEQLKLETLKRDSVNKKFVRSFSQIVDNLNFISETQKTISLKVKNKHKLTKEDKDTIAENVEKINLLMQQNKNISDTLKNNLSVSKLNMNDFGKMIDNLNQQMEEKNNVINSLKQNLNEADIAYNTFDDMVDKLTTVNVDMDKKVRKLQATIEEQQEQLNTAYYMFGSSKELKDAGVISKSGLAGSSKLSDNFNKTKFVKIDISKTKSIDVWAAQFYLITNHPTDSYKIEKSGKRSFLNIINPDEFWKVSKYLVIVKE